MAIEPRKFEKLWHKPQRDWDPVEALGVLEEIDRLTEALQKISEIRDSIIGRQNVNWSMHIYPLVAALGDAGFEGTEYPEARAAESAKVEQQARQEEEIRKLRTRVGVLERALREIQGESNG